MNPVLVDSNVLLDVATKDPSWMEWSRDALEKAGESSILVINPIIFAEVSIDYASVGEVDRAFPPDLYRREPLPYEAAFLAGKMFLKYRDQGGIRTSPLPDFFIGAHAAVAGYRLLTRDAVRYRTYFPAVPLIAPPSRR
jgi:predicted nucleic acid-binding protein